MQLNKTNRYLYDLHTRVRVTIESNRNVINVHMQPQRVLLTKNSENNLVPERINILCQRMAITKYYDLFFNVNIFFIYR